RGDKGGIGSLARGNVQVRACRSRVIPAAQDWVGASMSMLRIVGWRG
ncbi:hypothetical protein CBR_g77550, partial [Chara braunii]